MELFEAVTGRRSVRDYLDAAVSDDDLNRILDAGRWAPSWANTQCARYVIVKDHARKVQIKEVLTPNNPARDSFDTCPVIIAIVARLKTAGCKKGVALDDKQWHMYDCALAMQNMCLAAHALGLGTVIVGAFNYRQAGEILNVPADYQVVALLPLGYPKTAPKAPARKDLSELVCNESFGN